jgi:hypothetical protein
MSDNEDRTNEDPEDFVEQYAKEPIRKTIFPNEQEDLYPGQRGFRSSSVRHDEHDPSHDFDAPSGIRPLDYYFRRG